MNVLLDNLTATIVAMSVLAMLVAMQYRAQEASVERTIAYSAKKQTIEFGKWIQDDIANVGAGVSFGSVSVQELTTNNSGNTSLFRFRRKMNAVDAAPVDVTYQLVEKDTITVDGSAVYLFELQRRVDGTLNGASPPTVTRFRIEMLDENGMLTTAPSEARQVRVRFSTAMPVSDDRNAYLREAHWGTTVPIRNS